MDFTAVHRGDIFKVNFDRTRNRPIQKMRPALVVQNDAGNRYAPYTIVAAIREDAGKQLPIQVHIPRGIGGLTKDSVVDCGILSTIEKSDLREKLGRLTEEYLIEVEEALKVSLGIHG